MLKPELQDLRPVFADDWKIAVTFEEMVTLK